ncbi:Multiple sugar-binding protein [Microbacterium sp. Bi98]|nr:Multiple sugar-binding protein [Microbacterium sp. Bi98]
MTGKVITGLVTDRKRLTRLVALGAAIGLGATALAGCAPQDGSGDSGGSGERTSIRVMYATGDETWNNTVDAVVDAFNAQSDSTVVQLDPMPPGADYATTVRTMDATGNWPAVIDMRDTATYINAGKLAPIPEEVTDLLAADAFAPTEDGNVYISPTTGMMGEIGFNIVYNKDYFEEHALEEPATYDEFIKLMDDIKANGDAPLAIAAAQPGSTDLLFKPLAGPINASYEDGFWNAVASGEATMEELREPLERTKHITDNYALEGWASTDDPQLTTLLVNDQAVMITSASGLGRLRDINTVDPEFNAGMFIIPADDGTVHVLRNPLTGDTDSGWAISEQAHQDEAQYAAAIEFLEFYYSLDTANLIEKSGTIAPNISEVDKITRNTSIPGAKDYFALLENPKLEWYENPTNWSTFSTFNSFFRQSRVEMMTGQTTIDELIVKIQENFDSVIEDEG